MRKSRILRTVLRGVLLVPLVTLGFYACGNETNESDTQQEHTVEGYEDVVLAGEVTDETLAAFVAALEQGDPEEGSNYAPVLDEPTEESIPRTTSATFYWHVGEFAFRERRTLPLFSIPSAWAHGDAFTGFATYLVFSSSMNEKVLRVFTSETTFAPTEEQWSKIVDEFDMMNGEPITLTLVSVLIDDDAVAAGGGPFAGTQYSFVLDE